MPPSHPLSGLIRQSEGDFLFLISCETLYTIRTNNKLETFYFFCMNILQGNLKKKYAFIFRMFCFLGKNLFFQNKNFKKKIDLF